jgi:hypothetical protein
VSEAMSEFALFPEWKQAVKDFLDGGFKEGDVITKEWLEEHFSMPALKEPMTLAEFQARQFAWLRNTDSFRSTLLETHQIALQTIPGDGYRVVPPAEQTAIAQAKFEREATKAYRRAALTLKNVQVDKLTDAQRKENTDAIAKLSMLRGMQRAISE